MTARVFEFSCFENRLSKSLESGENSARQAMQFFRDFHAMNKLNAFVISAYLYPSRIVNGVHLLCTVGQEVCVQTQVDTFYYTLAVKK